MSSNLNATVKAELKTESAKEMKPEMDIIKEEKMEDVKNEVEVKQEPGSIKAENESSSPKLEPMEDSSQASKSEDVKSETVGDSSNNATTPKPRCKKGRVRDLNISLTLFPIYSLIPVYCM